MSLENIGLADAALSNLIAQWLDQPAKYPDNARSGQCPRLVSSELADEEIEVQ